MTWANKNKIEQLIMFEYVIIIIYQTDLNKFLRVINNNFSVFICWFIHLLQILDYLSLLYL